MQFDEKLMLRRYHKFQKNAAISFINTQLSQKEKLKNLKKLEKLKPYAL